MQRERERERERECSFCNDCELHVLRYFMKNFKKFLCVCVFEFFFLSLSGFFVEETDPSLCLSSDEGKNLGTHQHKRALSLSLSLSLLSTRRTLFIESLSLSLSLERRFGTCSRFVIIPRIIYFKRCRR